MRFIVDAQLPARLCKWLSDNGHDAEHTLELPEQNRTEDLSIARLADENNRIAISKDSDFALLKLLTGTPKKLLLIRKGNLNNSELFAICEANLDAIEKLFESFEIVEVGKTMVIGRNLE
ncbi:MAG: DUF5615 family PIN-like protein [Pyrinomonadaceae bacterium]